MEEDTLYNDYSFETSISDYSSDPQQQQQRPYLSHRYENESTQQPTAPPPIIQQQETIWTSAGRFLDFVTGPKFAFVVAIVVVVAFQFQDSLLLRWHYCFPPEQTVGESLCELWWCLHDYTRAYGQIATEKCRRMLHPQHDFELQQVGLLDSAQVDGSGTGGTLRSASNRVETVRLRRTASSTMPELEDVSEQATAAEPARAATDSTDKHYASNSNGRTSLAATRRANGGTTTACAGIQRRIVPSEIEPAFLKESDYPTGWVVYHTILGVVPKTEADQYDREQQRIATAAAVGNANAGVNSNGNNNANGYSTGVGRADARQEEEQPQQQPLRSIAATG